MGLSIACIAAIVLIVYYYDEKAVLQSVITLNTAVSVLSTAARSGLIFVVSAVVGQMKWCWIQKSERQLQHLQTMDSASRGPMGAIQMVALWTGGTLAAAGGILTVLLVAFSFLQQLLEYPLRDARTPSLDAWVPQNLAYNSTFRQFARGGAHKLELPSSDVDTPQPLDSDATCPVSRCSWHGVKSVGWCSKCEDVTATAALNNCTVDAVLQGTARTRAYCEMSLGAGMPLDVFLVDESIGRVYNPELKDIYYTRDNAWPISYGGKGHRTDAANALSPLNTSETFLGVENPLMVFGYALIGTNESPLRRDQNMARVEKAEMCILTLCEREYSVEKEGCATSWTETSRNYGTLFETRQLCSDEFSDDDEEPSYKDLACWHSGDNDSILEKVGDECDFADLSKRAFCPVQYHAEDLESHFPTQGSSRHHLLIEIPKINTTDDIYNFAESQTAIYPQLNFTTQIELVENALTKFGLDQTTNRVTGYTITAEAYVHVRWRWMIFPVALELATLTLFVLVVVHSRRKGVPIWKSSILAIIYHSVQELRDERSPPTERLSDMQSAASATGVGLWKSDDGLHRMARRPSLRDLLSPLTKHKAITDRIMREVFLGDTIYICERSTDEDRENPD
jgi:hypothetical protein